MSLTGQIHNGQVILDTPLPLKNGERVEVSVRPLNGQSATPEKTHFEIFREIIGIAEDLPEDFALNHDHYIHGTPKK